MIHHAFNCGNVRENPFFHAIRPKVGPDDDSDDENDYREQSNQFRVYRKKYEFNRGLIVSKYHFDQEWPFENNNRVVLTNVFLAESPDNSLKYVFWDIQYAPPFDDASTNFQFGFRGDQHHHFRWLAHESGPNGRMEVKMVPIFVHMLWGAPCAWHWQAEGKVFDFLFTFRFTIA